MVCGIGSGTVVSAVDLRNMMLVHDIVVAPLKLRKFLLIRSQS